MITAEALAHALQLHRAGALAEAEQLYLQILLAQPDHGDVLHLLGVLAYQTGRLDEAADRIGKALAVRPAFPEALGSLGNVLKRQGRLDDAIDCLRKAIALKPDFAEGYNNLGNALWERGDLAEAIAACRKSIELNPAYPQAHANLGNVLVAEGRLDEAIAAYGEALHRNPDYAEVFGNRGKAYSALGKRDLAIASYRRALALKPHYPEAHSDLGHALLAEGRLEEAVASYRSALGLRSAYPEAHNGLGAALWQQGKRDEAAACWTRALELRPDNPEALSNLGSALMDRGQRAEAVACYRRAIALKPDLPEALSNLGAALQDQGSLGEAVECFRKALALRPDLSQIHDNLGNALKDQGRPDEAVASYRAALALEPGNHKAHDNLIMTLHYCERHFDEDHCSAVRSYADLIRRGPARRHFMNAPDPARRLRIGYVSPDLRAHPVGYFLTCVLPAHDRSAVETFCYSNSALVDAITAGLRLAAGQWRTIAGMPDAEVDALIRQDGIDILVDLAGHTAGNRLALFAGRAAPVQATWLGYFGTTGLAAMDYILADRFVVLPGEEALFSETVCRMPDSYFCFAPPDLEVPVLEGRGVARPAGELVLGSFNNWSKVSEGTVGLWSRVLSAIPGSRLLLKTKFLDNPEIRRDAFARFARHGIAPGRLILEGPSPRAELLAAYNRMDIALDPFPFGGGATTLEALWMGVPVAARRGDRWVARVAESILATAGLPDLVADDADGYVRLVERLSADRLRREHLHRSLRSTLKSSPLCDGPRFARSLEVAYRTMWKTWCAQRRESQMSDATPLSFRAEGEL